MGMRSALYLGTMLAVSAAGVTAVTVQPAIAQSAGDIQARAFYLAALEALEKGNFSEALDLIRTAQDHNSGSNAQLSALEARAHAGIKDYVSASEALEEFYGFSPSAELQAAMAGVIVEVEQNVTAQRKTQEVEREHKAMWETADKLGQSYRTIWEQEIGGPGSYGTALKAARDGSVLVLAQGLEGSALHRIEADGSYRWSVQLGGKGTSASAFDELADGTIALVFSGAADPKTFKSKKTVKFFSGAGSPLSDFALDSDMYAATALEPLASGNFILTGFRMEGQPIQTDAMIIEYDLQGNTVRKNLTLGPLNESLGIPVVLSNDDVIVTGRSASMDHKKGASFAIRLKPDWSDGVAAKVVTKNENLIASPLLLNDGSMFWSGISYRNYLDDQKHESEAYFATMDPVDLSLEEIPNSYAQGYSAYGIAEDADGNILTVSTFTPRAKTVLDGLSQTKYWLTKIARDSTPIWRVDFADIDTHSVSGVVVTPDNDIMVSLLVRTDVENQWRTVLRRISNK